MITVYKQTLTPDTTVLHLPIGFEALSVQIQHGDPQIWYKCDPAARVLAHQVEIIGTGHKLHNPHYKYAGTFLVDGGGLVFHVFIEDKKA